VWSELAERYGGDEGPGMRNLVEHALAQKAEVLVMLGRRDEAVVVADQLVQQSGEKPDPNESRTADALLAKASALSGEGRYREAIEAFDEIIDRFSDAQEPRLRRSVAVALNGKVVALDRLGREEESEAVFRELANHYGEEALVMFDETVEHFAGAIGPEAREAPAAALFNKAYVLGELGRNDEALSTLNELIARFEHDENENVRVVVSDARGARDELLD
jgi:tetratricopeptide (TPR) repeat protein